MSAHSFYFIWSNTYVIPVGDIIILESVPLSGQYVYARVRFGILCHCRSFLESHCLSNIWICHYEVLVLFAIIGRILESIPIYRVSLLLSIIT